MLTILVIHDWQRHVHTCAKPLTIGEIEGVMIFHAHFNLIGTGWNPGMNHANKGVCVVMSAKTARRVGGTH